MKIKRYYSAIKYELKNISKLKLRNIPLLFRGFKTSSSYFYDFDKYNYNLFISDYDATKVKEKSSKIGGQILKDKLYFYLYFKNIINTPRVLGYILKGSVYTLFDERMAIDEFFKSNKYYILRMKGERGGKGIKLIYYDNNEYFINYKKCDKNSFYDEIKKLNDYLITEKVYQAKYCNDIFKDSTNTIRLLTVYNENSEYADAVAAIHRFGCRDSMPADNFARGGFTSWIDIDSGKMSKIVRNPKFTKFKKEYLSKHPETNAKVEDVIIPNWHYMLKNVRKAANSFGLSTFISWDIVMTNDEDIFTIIEAGSSSDLQLIQLHQPLLKNPKIKKLMNMKSYDN